MLSQTGNETLGAAVFPRFSHGLYVPRGGDAVRDGHTTTNGGRARSSRDSRTSSTRTSSTRTAPAGPGASVGGPPACSGTTYALAARAACAPQPCSHASPCSHAAPYSHAAACSHAGPVPSACGGCRSVVFR